MIFKTASQKTQTVEVVPETPYRLTGRTRTAGVSSKGAGALFQVEGPVKRSELIFGPADMCMDVVAEVTAFAGQRDGRRSSSIFEPVGVNVPWTWFVRWETMR